MDLDALYEVASRIFREPETASEEEIALLRAYADANGLFESWH
jgi:hypothetical protein